MAFYENVKSVLLDKIKDMAQTPWIFANNPLADFKRKRKMDFENLLRSIISMESGTVKHELLKHFDYDPETLTPSAYYQQRCKLHPDAFPYLFKQFLSGFTNELYRGKYQLIASDGCEFYIPRNPEDLDSYNPPCGRSGRGFNQLHVTALYDLTNRIYLDAIIQPCRKKNEYRALCDLMDRYSSRNGIPIFIADRGFSSYNCYAHAIENGLYFLIRTKDLNTKRLLGTDFSGLSDEFDYTVDRILTRTNSKTKRSQPDNEEIYRFICKAAGFDYIERGTPEEYPIRLRVVRFKITDDSYENIITNLPDGDFSSDEIKALYGLRWNIESSFRDLKYAIGAVNFHSINRMLINQEIWARLILYNFCSIITAHVVIDKKETKHTYQVNYSMAIKICHYFLRIGRGKAPPDIDSLISSCTLPIRLGRSFHRHNRIRRPQSFLYRFS
jgi:hypothetical protein